MKKPPSDHPEYIIPLTEHIESNTNFSNELDYEEIPIDEPSSQPDDCINIPTVSQVISKISNSCFCLWWKNSKEEEPIFNEMAVRARNSI